MRRLAQAIGLGCSLLLGLGACQPATGPTTDKPIVFALATAPTTLDPRYATDATSSRILRLLFAQLVDFDEKGWPVPALARWELLAPDHYRFHLLPGRRDFGPGRRLGARDVHATYAHMLDPANASPHRALLTLIEHLQVVDEDTLDFHLSRPDPLFPAYLTFGILPAETPPTGNGRGLGLQASGPFALVGWPEEGRLVLRRRSDGTLVEFLRVADPVVRILKLLRGELDLLQNDLPPELVGYAARQPGIQHQSRRGSNLVYLGFNLEDETTRRLQVRRAIARAIDREAILRFVLGGGGMTAEALFPPTHWAGMPHLQGYAYDPDQARALLAEVGYTAERPLRIEYKTSSDPLRIRIATIIQAQLAAVGIEARIRSFDWGTFYGDIRAGRFQMYGLSWVGVKTPDIFRYAFHSDSVPPNGANRGRFSDPAVDRLIEAAEAELSLEPRIPLYQQLQERLLEQLPAIPLWYEDQILLSRGEILDYRLETDGNYDGLIRVRRQTDASQRSGTH